MKVLLLSRYDTLGASSRIRSYQYIPALQAQGIAVTALPLFDRKYLHRRYTGNRKNIPRLIAAYLHRMRHVFCAGRFDLLWIEKELFPFLPAWVETGLKRRKIAYVVDYDDALFHRYDLNPYTWVRRWMGNKIDRVMAMSRLTLAGNRYLAGRAARAGAGWVEMVPSVVDLSHYRAVPLSPMDQRRKPFTIGWIGSPTTAHYLKQIEPALVEFCRQSGARVVVVGGNPGFSSDMPVQLRPWVEKEESAAISEFDVGIMPLPDTPWTRGKCGYKLIQYMACARPVIASGVNRALGIVRDGENGFLVDSARQWIAALTVLQEDRLRASAMGRKGRATVVAHYSLKVTAPRLAALFLRAGRKPVVTGGIC